MGTTTSTDRAADVADLIRSSAAWWRRAAEQLEAGELDEALTSAKLGRFGTAGAVEAIEELAST